MGDIPMLAFWRALAAVVLVISTSARAGPSQCFTEATGGGGDLSAEVETWLNAQFDPGTSSAPGTAAQSGNPFWNFYLQNRSPSAVSNATITIKSGMDASLFDDGGPVSSFPINCGVATL